MKSRERGRIENRRKGKVIKSRITWCEVLCFINQNAVIVSDLWILQLVQFQVACKTRFNDTWRSTANHEPAPSFLGKFTASRVQKTCKACRHVCRCMTNTVFVPVRCGFSMLQSTVFTYPYQTGLSSWVKS